MAVTKEQLLQLQNPETYKRLDLYPKWRTPTHAYKSASTQNGIEVVPYADKTDVQVLFDAVIGSENWANEPMQIGDRLYMSISINIQGEGWISKASVGTPTKIEGIKGEDSDALKRAATMWGAFRNYNQIGSIMLGYSGIYPKAKDGTILNTADKVNTYCNELNRDVVMLARIYAANKSKFEAHTDAVEMLSKLKSFLINA